MFYQFVKRTLAYKGNMIPYLRAIKAKKINQKSLYGKNEIQEKNYEAILQRISRNTNKKLKKFLQLVYTKEVPYARSRFYNKTKYCWIKHPLREK